MQALLASPDDEWAVLGPKVQKITDLMSVASGGNALAGGGGGGRVARGAQTPVSVATPGGANVAAALQDLYTILRSNGASDDQVKAKLEAYRAAKDAADKQLKMAQEDLKNYVTLRQEGILISLGYLE